MELSQLRYFSAVAQLGNMSKAAETMFVSQPNLSTSLSRLEEEVGVPLFERRRGKITLNQSGECFLRYVDQALSALEKGVQEVRNLNADRPEALSIACMVDDTIMLQQFLLKNPDISLNHQRADLPSVTAMLERQEVDLALTVLEPPGDDLAFERLYECEFVLLLNRVAERNPIRDLDECIDTVGVLMERQLRTALQMVTPNAVPVLSGVIRPELFRFGSVQNLNSKQGETK